MRRRIATLFVLVSLLLMAISSRAFPNHSEMIPGGDQRVIDEGTFNITCRWVLTVNDSSKDIDLYVNETILWTLPAVFDENNMLRVVYMIISISQYTTPCHHSILFAFYEDRQT